MTALMAGLEDEVRACSLLTEDIQRLTCFDALVDQPVRAAPDLDDPVVGEADAPPDFGLPERPAEAPGPNQTASRHIGEFRGWSGNTICRLENGQIWRQAAAGRMHWVVDSPLITVRRTSIGTYWLSLEGVNTQVRVRRVE